MTAWEGLNRRKFPRVNFPCLVVVRHDQEKEDVSLTHTENLGVGGISVTVKKPLKLFTPVVVELDLLDGNEHVKCKGKVVWSIRRKADEALKPYFYDMGVEFVELNPQDEKRIAETIESLVRKGYKAYYS